MCMEYVPLYINTKPLNSFAYQCRLYLQWSRRISACITYIYIIRFKLGRYYQLVFMTSWFMKMFCKLIERNFYVSIFHILKGGSKLQGWHKYKLIQGRRFQNSKKYFKGLYCLSETNSFIFDAECIAMQNLTNFHINKLSQGLDIIMI